jgi:RHS repeat-associated protein
VVWSAQYNAFGQATITTPTATDDKPVIESNLRFPGQIEDAETGLYYNWHRYYDPALGRYVTADPIGLVGGVNLYSYVNGNPSNETDIKGLLIPGRDCGKKQEDQIKKAEEEIQKELDKGCSECIKGACIPCKYLEKLRQVIGTVIVSCIRWDPKGNCAEENPVLNIEPGGFTNQKKCGCLKSVIYHEMLHATGLGNEDHYEIEKDVVKCFKCARKHDPAVYKHVRWVE